MVISRIGIGSLAKVAACLYGSIGLIVGVCVFLVSLLGLGVPSDADSGVPGWMAPLFGVGAVVVLPLLYATLGALALSVVGLLYNFAAGTVGGIQVDVDRPL
jgi:hypothetical protein